MYITFPLKLADNKSWSFSVIFQKMHKLNNRPKGENPPNLVTLSLREKVDDANLNPAGKR
jgi:hypothetical protein